MRSEKEIRYKLKELNKLKNEDYGIHTNNYYSYMVLIEGIQKLEWVLNDPIIGICKCGHDQPEHFAAQWKLLNRSTFSSLVKHSKACSVIGCPCMDYIESHKEVRPPKDE